MGYFRRTLNILATLLLIVAAVGFIAFLLIDPPRRPIPLAFILFFAGVPAVAHIAAAALAWKAEHTPLRASTAAFGIGAAAIAAFVWVTVLGTFIELSARESLLSRGWQVFLLFGTALFLSFVSLLNLATIRSSLLAAFEGRTSNEP